MSGMPYHLTDPGGESRWARRDAMERAAQSRMIVELPWDKPPLTGNRTRGNPYARAKEVREAYWQARDAVELSKTPSVAAAEVVLHFRPKDRRRRDADGMFPTLKVCQDSLVDSGVLVEDSWVTVPAATCRIHPPNGEPAAMWLELTNVTHYEPGVTP